MVNHLVVLDRKTLITESFHWLPSIDHQNEETPLANHSPELASHCTREIDRMWRLTELGITERVRRKFECNREEAVKKLHDHAEGLDTDAAESVQGFFIEHDDEVVFSTLSDED